VKSAGGHNYRAPCADQMRFAPVQNKLGSALFNPKELVNLFVHFSANFLFWLQMHRDELQMFAGEQYLPKEPVLFGDFFDGSNKGFHFLYLPDTC
jgi:hypothetical protein